MRYMFLAITIFLLLFVVSGCIEFPQSQADKVGWNQTKYEEYSAFYQSINHSDRGATVVVEIEDKLVEIPKDKNEFEKTWYLVFLNYKHGIEAENALKNSLEHCRQAGWSDTYRPGELECGNRNRAKSDAQGPAIKAYFNKAKEYRQKIEEMKLNLTESGKVKMKSNSSEDGKSKLKLKSSNDGKVNITEFLKFDCSHCYDVHKSLPSFLKKYDGKVTITYIPIVWPQQSTKSIEAYIIAEQMGKGKEIRDALFQAKFQKGMDIMENTTAIEDVAAGIGLGADFKTKLEDGEATKVALYNIKMMSDYGIQEVPALIINGNITVNPPTIANLEEVVNSMITGGEK